ncbi:hypothetical protein O6H91_15G086100 [Diphasiastrum complanatum]|uniref:Uncharacterized protein n=4 Tax=Diphasiastrum complanatum TaxID=34168 RepID=A0ACC2BKF9_DIPCM|nr:hypothetical protein O6H91_15G086100 [Diphasiastrum complanatum]KAJ7530235.1 hypothetical protein O6H91_15G086100 [Diphasiastrum complanatum]KAJ7530239.1 hypothetical protein O6H91_15G086100 [Diphasiastrum complanatum]KAJ7530240.1 hypothetical protein O6H91_15G086100 [Diphasiastrum complanatum]
MLKAATHSGLVLKPPNHAQEVWPDFNSIFSFSTSYSDQPHVTFTYRTSYNKFSHCKQISFTKPFTYEGQIVCQTGDSSNVYKLPYTEKSSLFDKKDRLLGQSPISISKQRAKAVITNNSLRAAASLVGQTEEEDSFLDKEEKVGVLLLNLGGPEKLDDVQPFLYNLFADPDIIRLPRLFRFLQRPLAKFISTLRAPKSAQGYAAIGGGSPLRKITDEQADALKKALELKNLPAEVYVGMRYWHPFTEEALAQIKKDGITRLVILPLYPQFSISTSGSSLRLLEGIFREDEYLSSMEHTVIPSWYHRGGYVQSMATLIEKELSKFNKPEEVHIFFSAHGVPVSYVKEAGDPYKAEMEECIDLIMTELKFRGVKCKHTLAYQSRVGPVEWLKPYTDEKIKELGKQGIKSLLAVPVSFVSEHIETLEEIDMEYRVLALESGIVNWGRVPALNCEPAFIADLADAVLEALPHAGVMSIPTVDPRPAHMGGL